MGTIHRIIGALGVCAAVAVLICYLTSNKDDSDILETPTISNHLVKSIYESKIANTLQIINTNGAPKHFRASDAIAELWQNAGLDDVHLASYEAFIPMHDMSKPAGLTIRRANNGSEIYRVVETRVGDRHSTEETGIRWLTYSSAGTVEGDVVYCNWGAKEDFNTLNTSGLYVKDRIALIRYKRGDSLAEKVYNAQSAGAIGAIIFADVVRNKSENATELLYIDAPRIYSLQRDREDLLASSLLEFSLEEAAKQHSIPTIPAVYVGRAVAAEIMKYLSGNKAKTMWQGSLNVTYRLGPALHASKKRKLKLSIQTRTRFRMSKVRNVIGYLTGTMELDSYIVIGGSYDGTAADRVGGVDNVTLTNSGMAIVVEMARVFGEVSRKSGWKPTRTIVFCAWDAEQYSAIGSRKFVEEFFEILAQRVAVYIDVRDLVGVDCSGQLDISAMPTLYDVIGDVARLTERVDENDALNETIAKKFFSFWHEDSELEAPRDGGAQTEFVNWIGVPTATISFRGAASCPITPIDKTIELSDKRQNTSQLVGRFLAELTRTFADREFLPLNVSTYAHKIRDDYLAKISAAFKVSKHDNITGATSTLQPENDDASDDTTSSVRQFERLKSTSEEFVSAAETFEKDVVQQRSNSDDSSLNMLTSVGANARLQAVEHCFVNIKRQYSTGHLLFRTVELANGNFNAIDKLLQDINRFDDIAKKEDRTIATQLAALQYALRCAVYTLKVTV